MSALNPFISPNPSSSAPFNPIIYESETFRVSWSRLYIRTITITIKPRASDADSSRWPDRTERLVDADGNVRYFVPADNKRVTDWKKKLGRQLVEEVVKPELLISGQRETCELFLICPSARRHSTNVHKTLRWMMLRYL